MTTDGLDRETPLFAASRDFACAHGGENTRAFVESLPSAWHDDVVIHSSLVWLTRGMAHDERFGRAAGTGPQRLPPPFRHEPFVGWTGGVRARANDNREALHRVMVVGGAPLVFATGMIDLDDGQDPAAFWLPDGDVRPRDRRIRGWLAEGTLRAERHGDAVVVEHGWGTFWCPQPASSPGFQLVVRATHRDVCPHVDGCRNVSFM